MFTIVNPPHLKQIQTNQREELTDIRKSDMKIQCVKPQIQDHSNKVPELSFRQFSFSAPGGIRYLKYRTPEEFIQVTCVISCQLNMVCNLREQTMCKYTYISLHIRVYLSFWKIKNKK